ncbi:MAG: NAD-dependent epimerase/dehydratase family protein [Methanomassiliicoccales archaeon]|nr:NAD-dependent epimerase/dehydratase family protein [Methanomassiliicoccales archaeon]
MKILVTGGSGQLGSYLLEDLSAGHEVWSIDLRMPSIEGHERLVTNVDIRDSAGVAKACDGVDAVVHAAAQVSVEKSLEDPKMDADINVIGTLSMLKASADAGVKKFVYISSAAVYGDPRHLPVDEGHPKAPKSFYGVSKLAAEAYVHAFAECRGLRYVIVRPFNFYSPRADPKSPYSGVITKFVERAKAGNPLSIEGDGEQTRDFINAKDVARMIRMAVESPTGDVIFNCGSGKATSINELAETLSAVRGGLRIEHVQSRVGDIRHSVADVTLAKNVLGFQSRISLEEGLSSFF